MSTLDVHIHAELVEACKKGDRLAQFRLYKLYSKAMFNICTRILGDQAAAEDALQEAFTSAFRKLHTFEGRATFGAWLKRIVVNKCLSIVSRNKMFTESLDDNMEFVEEVEEKGSVLESELNDKAVYEAIKSLPQGCRVIFTLYQLEGYDHQEISEILGVSVSTSKSQYHRAKKLLREKLQEHVLRH
ncbi:MAG: RNA polymerase sigma factor [Bacteroidota bacterium]